MWNNSNKIPATELLLCQPRKLPGNFSGGIGEFESLSKYKSDKPTRHIAVHTLNVLTPDCNDIFTELDILGEIKNVDPFVLPDTVIISYFKIRDAQDAAEYINTKYTNTYKAYFTNSCLPRERLDDRFFISFTLQSGNRYNYMKYLSAIGSIYYVSETFVSSTLRFVMIEYNGIRASKILYEQLNNVIIDGVRYQIFKCKDDHSICSHQSGSPTASGNIIQSPYPEPNQNHCAIPWDKTFGYFCFNPFSSESDPSSFSAPMTPEFTVSSIDNKFLAVNKNVPNTESSLNYQMNNDRLFDEKTLTEQPLKVQLPNERLSNDRSSKERVSHGRQSRNRPSKDRLINNKSSKEKLSKQRKSKSKKSKDTSSKDKSSKNRSLKNKTSKAKSADEQPSSELELNKFHDHFYPLLLTTLCIILLCYLLNKKFRFLP